MDLLDLTCLSCLVLFRIKYPKALSLKKTSGSAVHFPCVGNASPKHGMYVLTGRMRVRTTGRRKIIRLRATVEPGFLFCATFYFLDLKEVNVSEEF